jgi:hypothetical protein
MFTLQNATGELQVYTSAFIVTAEILIRARIKQGAEYIALKDLYKTLGADDKVTQKSIRWSVQRAKDANLIAKVKGQRGLYQVVR